MIFFDLSSSLPSKEKRYHGGFIYAMNLLERLSRISSEIRVIVPVGYKNNILDKYCIEYASSLDDYKSLENRSVEAVYINVLPNKFFAKLTYSRWRTIFVIHGFRELECPTDIYEGIDLKSSLKAVVKKYFRKQYEAKMFNYYESFYRVKSRDHTLLYASCFTRDYADSLGLHSRNVKVSTDILYPQFTTDSIESNKDNISVASIKGRYMLFLSANRWIKNPVRTLMAIEKSLKLNPDWNGVVVAPSDSLRRMYSSNPQIIFIDPCSPKELESLIEGSEFGIYSSLNEGFGLVPYEFATKGKPCIVSKASALPSVYGGYVRYVDPMNVSSIANAISAFIHNSKEFEYFHDACPALVESIRSRSENSFQNLLMKYL